MKKVINVGLIGYGTVGRGTVETLLNNQDTIRQKTGLDINLLGIADLSINKYAAEPLLASVPIKTTDAQELIGNPDIDIIVELVGGYTHAKNFMLAAIEKGKHIVTANKALLAVHGREIFDAIKAKGVEIGFEASVGGGIPIIKVIKEDLAANNVQEIDAIINGTANYILTRMSKEGLAYANVLKDAQELGYAEADPTFDVEGIDSAHKITLLASIAFGAWVDFKKVYVEGITQLATVDIEMAKSLGCALKLLAIAKRHADGKVEVRVHPTMVSNRYLLASVNNVYNAVRVTSDAAGDTVHYGKGAGGAATSSAVAADIINIARNIAAESIGRVPVLGFAQSSKDAEVVDIADISSEFYIRLDVKDTPGVLSTAAGILAKNGISIRSAIQRAAEEGNASVPLVFLTSNISGRQLKAAVDEISEMETVYNKPVVIRVME